MDKLREIRAAGEKVIVFARLLAVQQILSRVFEKEFGITVPVINGTTSRDSGYDGSTAATGRAQNARKGMVYLVSFIFYGLRAAWILPIAAVAAVDAAVRWDRILSEERPPPGFCEWLFRRRPSLRR